MESNHNESFIPFTIEDIIGIYNYNSILAFSPTRQFPSQEGIEYQCYYGKELLKKVEKKYDVIDFNSDIKGSAKRTLQVSIELKPAEPKHQVEYKNYRVTINDYISLIVTDTHIPIIGNVTIIIDVKGKKKTISMNEFLFLSNDVGLTELIILPQLLDNDTINYLFSSLPHTNESDITIKDKTIIVDALNMCVDTNNLLETHLVVYSSHDIKHIFAYDELLCLVYTNDYLIIFKGEYGDFDQNNKWKKTSQYANHIRNIWTQLCIPKTSILFTLIELLTRIYGSKKMSEVSEIEEKYRLLRKF